MKIGVLTSSRADYGIYLPLLERLQYDPFFEMEVLVFGTHLSERFGHTVDQILTDGFPIGARIFTVPEGDGAEDITESMARTMKGFSGLWKEKAFDVVFALGDRYEMFAAVASTVPFNLPIAHIHGGEESLGAIDNVFRHSITCMATYHFTCAEPYKHRVEQITGNSANVFNVGALSIDNLTKTELLSPIDFKKRFQIDITIPSILITFHPETVCVENNIKYVNELVEALDRIKNYQLIITMPNADTMGLMIRNKLKEFIDRTENAVGIESFGLLGYLSCMKHCRFMLGNTSSGFVEASYFKKKVINLGNRQKGRIITPNIINCPVEHDMILQKVNEIENYIVECFDNLYGNGDAAKKIMERLNKILPYDKRIPAPSD